MSVAGVLARPRAQRADVPRNTSAPPPARLTLALGDESLLSVPVSARHARDAAVLLQAAAIPLARRRELAAAYGRLRAGGLRHADATKAVAAETEIPASVLQAAIFRRVWDCPTCGALTFARLPSELVALDGAPAAPCCVETRARPRAARP